MADTLDAVNASFDDCEEVDDDIDMEADKPERDKAEPMIALDAVMGAEDPGAENTGDTAKADEEDKTVKAVEIPADDEKAVDAAENADAGKVKVVSIEQYRAG